MNKITQNIPESSNTISQMDDSREKMKSAAGKLSAQLEKRKPKIQDLTPEQIADRRKPFTPEEIAEAQKNPKRREIAKAIMQKEAWFYKGTIGAYQLPSSDKQRSWTGKSIKIPILKKYSSNVNLKPQNVDMGLVEMGGYAMKNHPKEAKQLLDSWKKYADGGFLDKKLASKIIDDYLGFQVEKSMKMSSTRTEHPGLALIEAETTFNRGQAGFRTMFRHTLGVMSKGKTFKETIKEKSTKREIIQAGMPGLSDQELKAVGRIESDPKLFAQFTKQMYQTRELYENKVFGARPDMREGLEDRWNTMQFLALEHDGWSGNTEIATSEDEPHPGAS